MITQEQVRDRYIYHADGRLTYRERVSSRAMKGGKVGTTNNCGYVMTSINGKFYQVHRLIFLYHHGYLPKELDHINGVKIDNRISNLRGVSHQENGKNQKNRCNNTSGHMGIYWHKKAKKWRAGINVDGKKIHLGYFKDIDDVVVVRKQAEIKYGYHKNHGRAA